jgi:hypothetical protein
MSKKFYWIGSSCTWWADLATVMVLHWLNKLVLSVCLVCFKKSLDFSFTQINGEEHFLNCHWLFLWFITDLLNGNSVKVTAVKNTV